MAKDVVLPAWAWLVSDEETPPLWFLRAVNEVNEVTNASSDSESYGHYQSKVGPLMPKPFDPPLDGQEVEIALPSVQVESLLGAGGQGTAFKVDYDERSAALKIYGPFTAAARVEREIKKLEQLRSPHVVGLYSHGTVGLRGWRCRYAIMEFVEGKEVSRLIGQLNSHDLNREIGQLLGNVAAGISDMWDLRVVHRDIKPANLMRRSDGAYVILDLGLAKHLDESTITQAGMACGTIGYMSPEQAVGRRALTFRSDLFSLGLVSYQLASGQHPFFGRQELIGKVPPPPLEQTAQGLNPRLCRLISDLLQTDPLRRPRRCADLLDSTQGAE